MTEPPHKVVLYAELNHGNQISESEIRGIVASLEKRGFTGWYERVPMNRFIRVIKSLKQGWDTLE